MLITPSRWIASRSRFLYNSLMWSRILISCGLSFLISTGTIAPATAGNPTPRGNRILSVSVNETPTIDYNSALSAAEEVGISAVSLPQNWDELETAPGVFRPRPNLLRIANRYYIGTGLTISLGINPIDTTNVRLPDDLRDKDWDDPLVIERYKRLLDFAFMEISALELNCLTIGNEIDGVLSTPEEWAAYETFFREVADYARGFWPGLRVGTKGMMKGMTGRFRREFQRVNQHADVIMVTYYPLNEDFSVEAPQAVHTAFADLLELYPDKPVYVMEIGYPSGAGVGGSQVRQADFISETFVMWDRYADRIRYLEFTWMNDQPPDQLDVWEEYYGLKDPNFREFLATLGLRGPNGLEKAGFERLRSEAWSRGWR